MVTCESFSSFASRVSKLEYLGNARIERYTLYKCTCTSIYMLSVWCYWAYYEFWKIDFSKKCSKIDFFEWKNLKKFSTCKNKKFVYEKYFFWKLFCLKSISWKFQPSGYIKKYFAVPSNTLEITKISQISTKTWYFWYFYISPRCNFMKYVARMSKTATILRLNVPYNICGTFQHPVVFGRKAL